MPYCYNCGVKLDETAEKCPLCGAKIPKIEYKDDLGKELSNLKDKENPDKLEEKHLYPSYSESTNKQKITSILEIISVSFIISILSIVLINFILEGEISWSKIPSVTIFFVWLIFASLLVFSNKILYGFMFVFISIFGYLISLDTLDKKISWSIFYGLPIILLTSFTASIIYLVTKNTKQKGLNLVAYYLLSGCFMCFGIDVTVFYNLNGKIAISWSKYVSFAVIPISVFLLYIHHRFSKQLPSKRVFRI